ncbi:hypothetical protein ACFLXQ_09145 [Chloroflexota bacterium]
MTDKPKITSLHPIVLADNRRVTFEMVVDNLPAMSSNVFFTMPDIPDTPPTPPKPDPDAPSPYPNIELSILNNQRQQVASLFIVEHKEKHTSLTLHLSAPDPQEQYTARAEITHQDQTLDVVEMPFNLNLTGSTDE